MSNKSPDIFYARQPIYNRELGLEGFELLFRQNLTDQAVPAQFEDNQATSQVLANAFSVGNIDQVCSRRPAFVNFSADMLDKSQAFPVDKLVVEVLETVQPNDDVIQKLQNLRKLGYKIALDDYQLINAEHPLLPLADIVKLDYPSYSRQQLKSTIKTLRQAKPAVKILAEKIEDQDDFELCHSLDCDLFQGYFLAKPEVIRGQTIPVSRLSIFELLVELNNPNADLNQIADLVGQDPMLTLRILKLVNSAMYNLQVSSLKMAIIALGMRRIRTFASILMLTQLADKPHELQRIAATRGSVCQALCEVSALDSDKGFTVGLFSCINAFFNSFLDDMLKSIRLEQEISSALLNYEGPLGIILHSVLQQEAGEFDHIQWQALAEVGIQPNTFFQAYQTGIVEADQNLSAACSVALEV